MAGKFKVHLIGIACSSHDVLLAPYCLKAAVMGDAALAQATDVRVDHHFHILPDEMEERCKYIASEIAQYGADVVGFSVYCWNRRAVECISQLARETNPTAVIVWGGPEISADDIRNGTYAHAPVDVLIVGEGEIPFKRLLSHFCLDTDMMIPRLAYRKFTAFFVAHNLDDPMADTLPQLYGFPSPYICVPPALLLQPGIEAVVETQRGCNFRCVYCQYSKNFPKIRYRNVADVLDEIGAIYHAGCKRLRFADGNFLSDKKHAIDILQGMVQRGTKTELLFEAIPSFIDDDVAEAIANYRESSRVAHNVTVGIGLQTINADSARAIKRHIPIAKFDMAYQLLNFAGVTIKTDVILGLPNETMASYLDMLEYVAEKMRHGSNFLIVSVLMVLPGTEMERLSEKYGLVVENGPEHFVYETPTMPRADMVECLRISAVAYRLFSTMTTRKQYYKAHDRSGKSHVEFMLGIAKWLEFYWQGTEVDFIKPDFPNAEHWWCFEMPKVITDDVMLEAIEGSVWYEMQ
jgi:radical SAM superfamily enzyme YgiQ (UPF0313 family)